MEMQLQELIDQIKKDGVEAAEAEAKTIVSEAKAEADQILADAKAQADKLLAAARAETERTVRSGEDSLRQAGRNLLISFRESVARELKAVTADAVAAAYSPDSLAELVRNTVAHWTTVPETENITVFLNDRDRAALEEASFAALSEKLTQGVTLRYGEDFDGGFRIAVNNGNAYYDYSSEAVVEMLSDYLSPKITALLKEAE